MNHPEKKLEKQNDHAEVVDVPPKNSSQTYHTTRQKDTVPHARMYVRSLPNSPRTVLFLIFESTNATMGSDVMTMQTAVKMAPHSFEFQRS